MVDTLTHTNGHAVSPRLPTIMLSSGYTVALRRQPADVMQRIMVRAEEEYAKDNPKPHPPTQKMETAPGEFHEIPKAHDPEYQATLNAWQEEVNHRATEKLLTLANKVALVFAVDTEQLKELRETYAEIGVDLPEDDRIAWLNYVIAPTIEDQARLFEEVYGKGLPTEAQVALHRLFFPGGT